MFESIYLSKNCRLKSLHFLPSHTRYYVFKVNLLESFFKCNINLFPATCLPKSILRTCPLAQPQLPSPDDCPHKRLRSAIPRTLNWTTRPNRQPRHLERIWPTPQHYLKNGKGQACKAGFILKHSLRWLG